MVWNPCSHSLRSFPEHWIIMDMRMNISPRTKYGKLYPPYEYSPVPHIIENPLPAPAIALLILAYFVYSESGSSRAATPNEVTWIKTKPIPSINQAARAISKNVVRSLIKCKEAKMKWEKASKTHPQMMTLQGERLCSFFPKRGPWMKPETANMLNMYPFQCRGIPFSII